MNPDSPDFQEIKRRGPLAVLCSGGVDSAVLLAEAVSLGLIVHPIYIRAEMSWEEVELAHLKRFLAAVASSTLKPLTILHQPVTDLYGSHWSITGTGVPDENSPDEAVFLPGRNVLLLAKALLWCHLNRVPTIAMAPLAANPFPDATPAFFEAFTNSVNMAVEGNVSVIRPYARLSKKEVVTRVPGLPLQHTFSCIHPVNGQHCGRCNKCAERNSAFRSVGVPDPTTYSS
ncbi:MAG: 7-cyano-7-deazaguanine synthase [Planctomycetes bacterium]|nr:7-cyano-7-deazaguanine synthase [Planctomycetota bacterium]